MTEPRIVTIQASGTVDIEGEEISRTELMAHALSNSGLNETQKAHEDFTIRRGSAFINEYARKDPITGQRTDGGPSDANHLLGSFPTLFPYGLGGFEVKREVDVPYEVHVRWAMMYHDRRFRKDYQFPFIVFGVCQKREVCRSAVLQMRKSNYSKQMDIISQLKPSDLVKASEEETKGVPFSSAAVRALRNQLSAVRTRVKGTDESRQHVRSKIWGTSLIFNPPSLWVTLNPADSQDPIAQVLAGADIDLDKFCKTAGPKSGERAANVASDPYASAQFFHFIIKTILETLFGIRKRSSGLGPDRQEGIFGKVQSYVGTVECQGRGTLHLHMLVWLHNAPTSKEMQTALKTDEFRDKVSKYIGSIIRADIDGLNKEQIEALPKEQAVTYSRPDDPYTVPEEERNETEKRLVRSLQVHNCSMSTCLRTVKGHLLCKRRAPFPTSDKDWIDENGEWGPKRTCGYLNSWNPTTMRTLRANHDVKLMPNGKLTSKITYYIAGYATKKQQKSSNTSALVANGYNNHRRYERKRRRDALKANRRLIQRCANSLTRHREFSAPEVMSYIMGWGDTYESHSYVSIHWDPVIDALRRTFPELSAKRSVEKGVYRMIKAN